MEIIDSFDKIPSHLQKAVVTVGNFDGVHRGHQELFKVLKKKAQAQNEPTLVITFYPHPVEVLTPEREHFRLFALEDLKEQLVKRGIDALLIHSFTKNFSQISPETFFTDYLLKFLSPQILIVGHDFSFGKNRKGDAEHLRELCQKHSLCLDVVPPFLWKGQVVSSTSIRQAAQRGDLETVIEFLDRPFYVKGSVERGQGRGKTLGFPTANMVFHSKALLKRGVYFTRFELRGKKYKAITNVGYKPTFKENTEVLIETHLLGTFEDFYGEDVKVEFLKFLREEVAFSSPEALVDQIQKDVEKAKGFFE